MSQPGQESFETAGRRQEKSAAMRARICAGAVQQLALLGYHRTSIKQVVDAAGVSQGALQHHFPSKDDLMETTAEYLLVRSVKWFGRVKSRLSEGSDAYGEVIKRSWREQFSTPEYSALLEILVAARTDKNLHRRIAPKLANWRSAIEQELSDVMAPIAKDPSELAAIISIGRCMMTGLLVHDAQLDNKRYVESIIDQWLSLVSANTSR